ncbi:hypothetical protein ABTY61_40105 [Kitasatospora sp. NPDC096128]|uniref:hypothetical protein n=1 Tax=Kitasatospora sp. NPDC096128 TaxID=3155547 RepID=UPI00333194FD
MSVARVAVVTSDDGVECDVDLPLIVDALRAGGLSAEPVVWDTAAAPWERFGLAVIRSTWDYVERLDEFLIWADATAAVTRLWNPAPIVRWNSDKHYLAARESNSVFTHRRWTSSPHARNDSCSHIGVRGDSVMA